MKRKILTMIICCCFIWVIYLKEEAQIGIFKDTPVIEVPSHFFTRTSTHMNYITFKYKGKQIKLPYSSIAYWYKDCKD